MPTFSSLINEKLKSSLFSKSPSKDGVSQKVCSSTKRALLEKAEIKFVKAQSDANSMLKNLKNKYVCLNEGASAKQSSQSDPTTHVNSKIPNDGITPSKRVLFSDDCLEHTWRHASRIGAGLNNLGNTCFLNSVLQCLTYTPTFANYLLSGKHRQSCKSAGFCMLCELQQHVTKSLRSGGSIKPLNVLQKLKLIAKHMRWGRQEDAHEFLRYVIDSMQKSALHGLQSSDKQKSSITTTTFVHAVFGGFLRSQVRCLSCKTCSDTYDPVLDLSLDLKSANSVESALQRFVAAETLDADNAYTCRRCKTKVRAVKQFTVHRAPRVLTLHLKRFDHTRGFMGGKVSRHVDFTQQLNLRPYMSDKQGSPLMYQLYGVLVHSGHSCNSGHYYCYVKSPNHTWYCMNDSMVSQSGLSKVLSAEAYILFYSQVSPKPKQLPSPHTTLTPNNIKPQQNTPATYKPQHHTTPHNKQDIKPHNSQTNNQNHDGIQVQKPNQMSPKKTPTIIRSDGTIVKAPSRPSVITNPSAKQGNTTLSDVTKLTTKNHADHTEGEKTLKSNGVVKVKTALLNREKRKLSPDESGETSPENETPRKKKKRNKKKKKGLAGENQVTTEISSSPEKRLDPELKLTSTKPVIHKHETTITTSVKNNEPTTPSSQENQESKTPNGLKIKQKSKSEVCSVKNNEKVIKDDVKTNPECKTREISPASQTNTDKFITPVLQKPQINGVLVKSTCKSWKVESINSRARHNSESSTNSICSTSSWTVTPNKKPARAGAVNGWIVPDSPSFSDTSASSVENHVNKIDKPDQQEKKTPLSPNKPINTEASNPFTPSSQEKTTLKRKSEHLSNKYKKKNKQKRLSQPSVHVWDSKLKDSVGYKIKNNEEKSAIAWDGRKSSNIGHLLERHTPDTQVVTWSGAKSSTLTKSTKINNKHSWYDDYEQEIDQGKTKKHKEKKEKHEKNKNYFQRLQNDMNYDKMLKRQGKLANVD